MSHLHRITRPVARPAVAGSILAKAAQLNNLLSAVMALQELSDLLRKEDTHDN